MTYCRKSIKTNIPGRQLSQFLQSKSAFDNLYFPVNYFGQ
jgi:hypothetical protein